MEDGIIKYYELIKMYNLKVEGKGSGKNMYLHCPFHDDAKASFIINKENGLFNCMNPQCECHNNRYKDGGKQDVDFLEKLLKVIDKQYKY